MIAELELIWGLLYKREVGILADLSWVFKQEFNIINNLLVVSKDFKVCFVTLPEQVTLLELEDIIIARY